MNVQPLNILVTGGGGFLGKAIVKLLIKQGHSVTSFARGYYTDLEDMGVRQYQGDLKDSAAVINAAKGMDGIYHVGAKPGVWGKYQDFHDTNVVGTQNVLKACFTHNIKHLIYTSSPSVVFNGLDMEGTDESAPYPAKYLAHYPKTKALAEQEVVKAASQGLGAIILRPHLIWGPEDNHLVPRIIARANRLARIGRENKRIDTIYIDNAAKAHVQSYEKLVANPSLSGNIYFISQDAPIPLWDMVNAILKTAAKPPVTRTVPIRLAWAVGALMEMGYKVFHLDGEPPMTRFVAEELSTAHWFDISAAKKDLAYVPEVSTDEGLRRLKDWLNQS